MIGLTGEQVESEFALGNVAMFFSGPWVLDKLSQVEGLDFGVMPLPGLEEGQSYYVGAPGVGFAVNSKTDKKEEALLFLEYLSSEEGLQLFYEGTNAIITANGFEAEVHPACKQAYEEGLMGGKSLFADGDMAETSGSIAQSVRDLHSRYGCRKCYTGRSS